MHVRRLANLWLMPGDAAMQMASGEIQAKMDAMSDDMPCCPDQTKSKTCDGCPFAALCMLSVPLPAPAGAMSLVERHPLRSQFAAHDDRLVDGLGTKPPDHPPRTHV
ncbi:hypothetical protein [Bradyrhizobium genosp. P]|uniref:hypothetical protein n=1 Tax=Bradyrhizobium genosp. P TaxID=83641 RepID=UPI003CEFE259